jgi:hypothetical protein
MLAWSRRSDDGTKETGAEMVIATSVVPIGIVRSNSMQTMRGRYGTYVEGNKSLLSRF